MGEEVAVKSKREKDKESERHRRLINMRALEELESSFKGQGPSRFIKCRPQNKKSRE